MIRLIEETEVSDLAVKYLQEVQRLGGEISWGNREHNYLTSSYNIPNDWEIGRRECSKLGLMKNSDSGYEGTYFRVKITERGLRVLEIAAKETDK